MIIVSNRKYIFFFFLGKWIDLIRISIYILNSDIHLWYIKGYIEDLYVSNCISYCYYLNFKVKYLLNRERN